jgi:hypothetical protein
MSLRQPVFLPIIGFINHQPPLVSISPTFYEQFLRQIPFAKKLQTQIVST